MRRPLEDLETIEKPGIRLPAGVHLSVSSKEIQSNEINLLGCKVDEAVERVDKFLDEASLAQLAAGANCSRYGNGGSAQCHHRNASRSPPGGAI